MSIESMPGLQANQARIAVTLSQFTVPLLSRIYHAFGGDVVAAIVLGEIAHRNVLHWLSSPDNPEAPLHDASRHREVMRPCNALSIAEACGLPRETVRRKVVALIERGYLYRSDEGHLYLKPGLQADFEPMTQETIEALLATAKRLEALLAGGVSPSAPSASVAGDRPSQPAAKRAR